MRVSAWLRNQQRIQFEQYIRWEELVFEEEKIVEELSEQEKETLAWLEKDEAWRDSRRNGLNVPFDLFVWPLREEGQEEIKQEEISRGKRKRAVSVNIKEEDVEGSSGRNTKRMKSPPVKIKQEDGEERMCF